ncbi:hypothetical protein GUITHDRAFT_150043 [Guillardia theta CCMP2712]|uniref:Uncharacterized protein n=1 Tax=Guillardia theta (strain CCMP2712) TaxID=905079 RepID=L1K271_GUITC|nr:hypothetical protein GUITHDRAFT_150043 [Guillardia theta CCMP2712]EKX54550.1 hypothetical protein GUITHDRAFT_150043 [Guillardia theta CCMP2712]|eukprot:XP_005841530.1 hypothetical protein GUITHDRAFT_150043 [Guillardia theta CCMP2712]
MLEALWQYFHKLDGNVCLQWTVPHPARPNNQFVQFMNQDYVGQSKGRCSTAGFDKNELKFSAYVKQPNPFQPKEEQDPEVHLA